MTGDVMRLRDAISGGASKGILDALMATNCH
jgi:hypothetical protein